MALSATATEVTAGIAWDLGDREGREGAAADPRGQNDLGVVRPSEHFLFSEGEKEK